MSVNSPTLSLLVCSSLLFLSCGEHTHDSSNGHEVAEWPARAQTVWSPRHEFFFENDFAVIGQPAGFALHVSNLSDGSPRETGPMSMIFDWAAPGSKGSPEPIRVQLDAPMRSGIYLTDITFPTTGEWYWEATVDGDHTQLQTIIVYADEAAARLAGQKIAAQAQADGSPSGEISMLKEQQWPVRLMVETAAVRKLANRVPATARISACRTHTAQIASPTNGTLWAPPQAKRAELGQQVKAGELLAVLRIPLLGDELAGYETSIAKAKQEVTRADAALTRAQSVFNRVEALFAKQAKSKREMEEAQFDLTTAQAAQTASREVLAVWEKAQPGSAMDLPLRAPISGQITHAPTASGEWVAESDLLFHIQDLSQLHVSVRVPETDLPQLGERPTAEIPHPTNGSLLNLPGAGGKLLLAAPTVHPVTHSAEILYEINNPGWLRAGMTLPAHLFTGEVHEALAIPTAAMVDDAGIPTIFVQTGGEAFTRRVVRLGSNDGHHVEILAGLTAGEQVVIDGAYIVHLVSLSGVIPEHSH